MLRCMRGREFPSRIEITRALSLLGAAAALACFLLLPSRTIDCGAKTAAAEETKERGYGRGHGNLLQRNSPAGHHASQLSQVLQPDPVSYTHLRAHETRHDL